MSEPVAEGAPTQGEPSRDDHPTNEQADNSSTPNPVPTSKPRRRRGSRGGRNRNRPRGDGSQATRAEPADGGPDDRPELPDLPTEGRPQSVEAAERALVR